MGKSRVDVVHNLRFLVKDAELGSGGRRNLLETINKVAANSLKYDKWDL